MKELIRKIIQIFKGSNLTIEVETSKDGGYIAHFKQVPDTYGQGEGETEAILNLCKTYLAALESEDKEKAEKDRNITYTYTNKHITKKEYRLPVLY